jgi:hypothetical protein
MVRGNWQRRVELSESRRNEAKQKKQHTGEKKVYKHKAQTLLGALDRSKDVLWQQVDKNWEIHLWVDSLPSDQTPIEDSWNEEDTKNSKRRNRASSIESENSSKSGRSKSGSGKKKHPRSKEIIEDTQEEQWIAPRLCRSQFYTGECKNRKMGKKSGCANTHYPKKSKTFAEILNSNEENESESNMVIASSDSALSDAQADDEATKGDSQSMEMLYYISIPAILQNADGETTSFSECIAGVLAKQSCSIASIVYLAFNGTLLFDRYREGLLLSDNDLRTCLSMVKSGGRLSDSSSNLAKLLPGSVLEYVLTFLSEHEIAGMSSVCKPWNTEIGKESANLWRHCLERRGWPVAPLDDDGRISDRRAFLSHYSAVRNLKAVQFGMTDILTKKTITSKDAFSKSFDASKGAPQYPDFCAGIDVWSPNQILAAYSEECTLRLFTTTARSGNDGDKFCRELVCQNIDPYRNTRKKACRLVDLALDETQICCLGRVAAENVDAETTLLLFLSRDDFLVSDVSEEERLLQVIDVREAVLDFLLDSDGDDDDQMEFLSYLSTSGGDLDDVEVLVSQSLVACANGLFLFHASWSIPPLGGADDGDRVFQKLFFFSASAGTIVVMRTINSNIENMTGSHESMALTSSVRKDGRGSYGCIFASSPPVSLSLTIGSIDPNGRIHTSTPMHGTVPEGYSLCQRIQRPMAICGSQIIVADATVQVNGDDSSKQFKSLISFHSCSMDDMTVSVESIEIQGNFEVLNLYPNRDEHVLALCRLYPRSEITNVDAIDGHWFGPSNDESPVSLYGIIFHVPSRTEIQRVCLLNDLEESFDKEASITGDIPISVAVDGGTVVAGIWWRGIVMTGEEVRQVQQDPEGKEQAQSPKAKKKKKKTAKKGGKKDGFARGMSSQGV